MVGYFGHNLGKGQMLHFGLTQGSHFFVAWDRPCQAATRQVATAKQLKQESHKNSLSQILRFTLFGDSDGLTLVKNNLQVRKSRE